MWGNFKYLTQSLPDRHISLYQDARLKQIKYEEQREIAHLEQLRELAEFEDSQAKAPQPQRRRTDFYEYNRRWQSQIQQKRQQQRTIQNEETQPKMFQREPDPYLPTDYQGPIKGWKSRTETTQSKVMLQETFPFHPQINEKSIEICQRNDAFNSEPVEERLLKYGHDVENKKMYQRQQELFTEQLQIERNFFKPNVHNSHLSDNRPVYERLYEYGSTSIRLLANIYERRKEEYRQEDQSDFHPATLQLPPEVEAKVNEKRKVNPLYQAKPSERHPTYQEIYEKQEKKLTPEQLALFLQRNYDINRQKTPIDAYNKEDEELRECSFQPYINPKSIDMVKDKDSNVVIRSQELLKNKHRDVERLQQEVWLNEMVECSFQPNMSIDVLEEKKNQMKLSKEDQQKKHDRLELDKQQRKLPVKSVSPRPTGTQRSKDSKKGQRNVVEEKGNNNESFTQQDKKKPFDLTDLLKRPDPTIDRSGDINKDFQKVEQQILSLFDQIN